MRKFVNHRKLLLSSLILLTTLATSINPFTTPTQPLIQARPQQTEVQEEAPTPAEHADEILATLADTYPDHTLPNYILTENTPLYITAATTGTTDQENFNIFYYAEDEPIQVDNPTVNELDPIASFEVTTYETTEEAIEAVNQVLDPQGEEINLGYDLTGFLQGAAGSTYLHFTFGNWSTLVQANNAQDEDPEPLAQDVADYIQDVFLPAPSDVGQINLRVAQTDSHDTNTAIWNEDHTVYQVTHFDPMQAVRMTGSISEPK